VTFAAPIPGLIDRGPRWARPSVAAGKSSARQLPPPPPGAVSSPGPAPWSRRGDVDHFRVVPPPRDAHSVVGREVADAFELIWPTGEIDEQFLGGPLSEMPAPGAPYGDSLQSSDPLLRPLPMTVRLKPLPVPPEVSAPSRSEPVSDDVVLAIQRAIAAIGSELVVTGEPPAAPLLPDRCASDRGTSRTSAPHVPDGNAVDSHAAADQSDARRSALKRLIGGLRRR